METRERNGKWMTSDVIDILWASFESLKEAIADAEARLQDISFDVGTEPDYDGDRAYAYIKGWRDATPEEIQARKDELAEIEEQQRRWEENMAEQLRQSRPELFKDD